jgi:hypothetical protein
VKSIPLVAEASGSGNVEVTRLLLRRGASIDDAHLGRVDGPLGGGVLKDVVLPPGVHTTPLSVAVARCHYDAARRLLRHGGSKSTAVIFDGKSLMEAACYYVLDNEKSKRGRMRALLAR